MSTFESKAAVDALPESAFKTYEEAVAHGEDTGESVLEAVDCPHCGKRLYVARGYD
jgi:hypothetical protein